MVLVDTSIWIHFLSGREPMAAQLSEMLARGEVAGHDLVFGELLIGDRGGRRRLLSDYRLMTQAATVAHCEVVEFVHARRLNGRGAGWIDVHLLASALLARIKFWTGDPRLAILARELRIAYHPLD